MLLTLGIWLGITRALQGVGTPPLAPPWFVVGRDEQIVAVLADGVDPAWLGPAEAPRVEERSGYEAHQPRGVYRAVRAEALPAALRGLVGRAMTLFGANDPDERIVGATSCVVHIKALWAASVQLGELEEGSDGKAAAAFAALADGFDHVDAGRGWAAGRPMLVATLERPKDHACDDDAEAGCVAVRCPEAALGVLPEGTAMATLRPEKVAAKVRKSALRAVAGHVVRRAGGRDEGCERGRKGLGGEVHRLVDAGSVTRLIEVELGRDSRCLPERQVAVLTPDFEVVDVAPAHQPRAYLDWDGNGRWDRLEYGLAATGRGSDRARSAARVVTLDGAHQVLAGFRADATLRLETQEDGR